MQKLLFSGLINTILFSIVLVFLKPLLNSGDDAFVMYTFSGAFGIEPTHLVDYNHVWHFALGKLIVQLFIKYPEINWYTGFLLLFHFFSGSLICYLFLDKLKASNAIFIFLLFFIFFEIPFLLSLSFTNSSVILTVATNLLLLDALLKENLSYGKLAFSVVLLIAAGLLRFHAWGFAEFFFIPFLLFFKRSTLLKYAFLKFTLLATLVIAFQVHAGHYKNNVSGWEEQEVRKQILYSLYNKPNAANIEKQVFVNEIEREFFSNGFFYDTSVLNDRKLENIVNGLIRKRDFSMNEDANILYWSFMEARVFLFLFFITILFLFVQNQRAVLLKAIPFLFLSLLLYIYLFVFRKITGYMFITFFAVNWLIILLLLFNEKTSTPISKYKLIGYILVFISITWMVIRLNAINNINLKKYSEWLCSFRDLKANSNKIHIATNNMLPIDFFSITDVPQKFPINNYITISQFSKHLFQQKLLQFNISNVTIDLILRNDMVLIGNRINSLEDYYSNYYNKSIKLVEDAVNYNCEKAYKVQQVVNK